MWSKFDSAHAQHWWTQGSKEKTDGERGAFEAALCSSGLGWGPTKPCYSEETVVSQRGDALRIVSAYRTVSTSAVLVPASVPPIEH